MGPGCADQQRTEATLDAQMMAADVTPDLTIGNVMDLEELFMPTATDDEHMGRGRPFRSLSMGDRGQNGRGGNMTLPKRFARPSLPDLDSCSSNSSADCS